MYNNITIYSAVLYVTNIKTVLIIIYFVYNLISKAGHTTTASCKVVKYYLSCRCSIQVCFKWNIKFMPEISVSNGNINSKMLLDLFVLRFTVKKSYSTIILFYNYQVDM